MKVYVVIVGEYSDAHIKYVATSRKIAEALAKRAEIDEIGWRRYVHIEEYEVFNDTSVMQEQDLVKRYRIVFQENGEIYGFYEDGYSDDYYSSIVSDYGKGVSVTVFNNDVEVAKKIACDARAKYLAEKYGL